MKNLRLTAVIICLLSVLYLTASTVSAGMIFANVKDYQSLFQKLQQNGFSQEDINVVFSDSRLYIELEILTLKKKRDYSDVFTKDSVVRGKICLAKNDEILKKVEETFGVAKEFLVSIFRIETDLGLNQGKYIVTNALFTLWAVKNRRSEYFGGEFVNWLVICKKHKFAHFSVKGSSAGAFGLMQFMPTSFLNFAIDGDGDGKINLFEFKDAMFSAANYLKGSGWRKGNLENNKKVIISYNRSEDYRDAVVKYVKLISNM